MLKSSLALGVLILSLSGCGSSHVSETVSAADSVPSVPSSSPSIPPSKLALAATPSPAAPGEKIYPEFGLRTLPAPADSSPSVTQTQAENVAAASSFGGRGLLTGKPKSELRLLTDGDFPGSSQASRYRKLPVWVVTYFDSPAVYRGGPNFTPPPVPVTCDFVIMVDAKGGQIAESFQTCPGTALADR